MGVDPTKVTTTTTSSAEGDTDKTPAVAQSTGTKATPTDATQSTPPAQSTSNSAPVTTSLDIVARVPKRGDVVDYVLKDGYHSGEKRPLLITRVWDNTPNSLVNGQVITDGVNDFITAHPGASGLSWATSVSRDDTGTEPGTWSFSE
jgi:hypothetical protein